MKARRINRQAYKNAALSTYAATVSLMLRLLLRMRCYNSLTIQMVFVVR